jgi:hypothetical protein
LNPKIFILIGYACIFWYLCYKRPMLALAISFAFCPVALNVLDTGFNASFSDLNIALCVPLLLLGRRNLRNSIGLGPMAAPIWAYLIICLASSIISNQWDSTMITWLQMFLYFVITTLVFANFCKFNDLALIPYYAVGVGTLWALVGLATNFNTFAAAKNSFGASLSAVLIVIYSLYATWHIKASHLRMKAEGIYLTVAGVIVFAALVLSLSRGAWLGTICGLILVSIYSKTHRLLGKIVVFLIPVAMVTWLVLPDNLKFYALNFDSSSAYNIKLRYDSLAFAKRLFFEDPLWGAGTGYRKNYDATNVIWSTLAETGIIGFIAFGAVFYVFYRWTWKLRKVITPHDPRFLFISMAVGLMTARIMHGMVDHYWSRGVITMSWASVGMVMCLARTLSTDSVQTAVRQIQQSIPHNPTKKLPSLSPVPNLRRGRVRRRTVRRSHSRQIR